MSIADDLPTRLRQYYRSEADLYPADGQLPAVLARTQAIHPRPAWRGLHSGPGAGASVWWVLRQPRVAWATLAILTALLMVAAAIVGQPPDRPPDGSSRAILIRGYHELEVVVVRADGQERSLGLIPESVAGPRRNTVQALERRRLTEPFVVSPTGRLAVGRHVTRGLEWAFFVLGDSNPAPVKVLQDQRRSGPSGTWDADNHFIAGRETAAEWIDSSTGAIERRPAPHVSDWLSPQVRRGEIAPEGEFVWTDPYPAWIFPRVADAAAGDLTVYQSRGARFLTAAGAKLETCFSDLEHTCPDPELPNGAVTVSDPTGAVRVAYSDELRPARTVDAGFASDGRSVWVLLVRGVDGREAVLARITPEGVATIVAAVPLPAGMDLGTIRIGGMAPDDSVVVISAWSDKGDGAPGMVSIVVPTAGDGVPPTYHDGTLAGFMPAPAVDAIPATSFAPGPNADPLSPDSGPSLATEP
jgi:hypothetical protein